MWLCSGYRKANRIIEGFACCFVHLLFVLGHFFLLSQSEKNMEKTPSVQVKSAQISLPGTTYRALELGFEGYFPKKLTTRVSYSAGAAPRAAAWPARGTTQNSFGPVAAL